MLRIGLLALVAMAVVLAAVWFFYREPVAISDVLSHDTMREVLAEIASDARRHDIYVGSDQVETARAALDRAGIERPLERWMALYALARAELNLGQEESAIDHYRQAESLLKSLGDEVQRGHATLFMIDYGVAYLRQAETHNCCQSPTGASCLFPITREGQHREDQYSRQAMVVFDALLDELAARGELESDTGAAACWLLNLSAMTVGEYPDGVDPRYRIDPDKLGSDQQWPVFPNVAAELGVARFSLAGGAVIEDFDMDGDLDLFTTTWDPAGPPKLFENTEGKLADRTDVSGLGGITGGLNVTHTDYNNDGYCDLYVLRGGWLGKRGQVPNSLLRNNGDATFTDVTFQAGLATPPLPSQTATWLDFDLDGDLDVYVGNESTPQLRAPSQLFRNNGDGSFTDIAIAAGVTNDRMAKAVTSGDVNGDRYPDLYVSNYQGENRLYRNNADGTFTDVAQHVGVTKPLDSFTCWFWDYNNDGRMDIFVSAYAGGVAEVAASYLDRPFDRAAALARLYQATDDGTFIDVAEAAGLTKPHHPMGANFADIDNDGYLDFYLGTGWPEYREIMPNALYRNIKGQRFQDVTISSRTGHLQKGHAVAFGDIDNDGDLDLFEQLGGFVPGDRFYDVLFQNPGFAVNRWIGLQLVGNKTCRAAIGAVVKLTIEEHGVERTIFRTVGQNGTFGEGPFRLLIGVGETMTVKQLVVTWPVDGQQQVFADLTTNRHYVLHEGEALQQK
ncbi:MAG: FG-GAP-like repeat-containing protein [Pirellulaceae bacterium]